MPQLFTNNARALLVASINSTATSIVIESDKADLFPVANVGSGSLPSSNNWFKLTLQDSSGNVEIVYVRTRTAGSGVLSNVIRGQEGTTAASFSAGTVSGLRVTAADLAVALTDVVSQNNTFTGDNTFDEPILADGGVVGNVTGNLTGNVTGNLTGNVTGNISGSAGSLATTNWTIAESSGKLVFSYGGVAKFSISSAGLVIAASSIRAGSTP